MGEERIVEMGIWGGEFWVRHWMKLLSSDDDDDDDDDDDGFWNMKMEMENKTRLLMVSGFIL